MKRVMIAMVLTGILLAGFLFGSGQGAEMKVIQTHKAKDVVVALLSESGQWTQGKNSFVLEFTSADTKQPKDVGKVTLSTRAATPKFEAKRQGASHHSNGCIAVTLGGYSASNFEGSAPVCPCPAWRRCWPVPH